MVDLEPLEKADDLELVRDLLTQHAVCTGSTVAMRLLKDWTATVKTFVKVMPLDYRRVLSEQNPTTSARPDPISLEQWWQERYPGHLRTSGQAHAVNERPMLLEVSRG
jgi:hypothetical protein